MITRNVTLTVDGLRIRGQFFTPGDTNSYPAICICHGIPSGQTDPLDRGYPSLAERFCREGFTTFIFNFRGARNSEGNFDIMGWTRDLTAAIDYLMAQIEVDKTRLALVGFSAGAAVSIWVAAQDSRIGAVASCACPAELSRIFGDPPTLIAYFRKIGIIRDADFPASPDAWTAGFRLVNPLAAIHYLAPRPLLVLHGSRDDLVPVENALQLFQAAEEPKQLLIVDGSSHQLRQDDRAVVLIIEWLKSKLL